MEAVRNFGRRYGFEIDKVFPTETPRMKLSLTKAGELLILYTGRGGRPEGWVRDLAFMNARDNGVVTRACRNHAIVITTSNGQIE